MSRRLVVACAAVLALASTSARAQQDAGTDEPASASPRASTAAFLELCREAEYEEAASYLHTTDRRRAPELARRLKAVLDRHQWVDLAALSADPAGDLDDGLPASAEELGRIPRTDGTTDPVQLTRRADGTWAFSEGTVARVDVWYDELEQRWLLERLPTWLLRPGPAELAYWQWLALAILIALSVLIGVILGRVSGAVLRRVVRRTDVAWDDALLEKLRGPLAFAWGLAAAYALLPLLGLYRPAEAAIHGVLHGTFFVVFFWGLLRSVTVAGDAFAISRYAAARPGARSLIPLGTRLLKVAVVIIAVVAILSQLGYSVASLVAGLGIGGLAVALAAQKTMENLFGAFAIGTDQPFRVGDFVKIEDFVGTVEVIGLRSTRIRTLDRTLITIPNGKLADTRTESFTLRDRMRLACTVGLVYETTAAQMREVLAGLERCLREHPKIWPDTVTVRFKELGSSSLDIEVMAWFQTTDWNEFMLIRQEVLLEFMEIVERAGSSFAFPTRTVHIARPPEAGAPTPHSS